LIIQGDNGTRLKLHIQENNVPLDLSGANVEVKIKIGMRTFTKIAEITDIGECEIELTSDDLATSGIYTTQATVTYTDESKYSSDIQRFSVGKKL
jgi:hypothetical protein